jgi:hypothetical protein
MDWLHSRTGSPDAVWSIASDEEAKERLSDAFAEAYLVSTNSGKGFGSDLSILRQLLRRDIHFPSRNGSIHRSRTMQHKLRWNA